MATGSEVILKQVNKVEIDGVVKLDLTDDSVIPATLVSGYTAHDRSGQRIYGTLDLKATLLLDNVALSDGLLSFDSDLQDYQSGRRNCMIIEDISAPAYKAFVWLLGRTWLSVYSNSGGLSLRADKVSVVTSTETNTAHFDIELSDSSGIFYAGSVRIYDWTD